MELRQLRFVATVAEEGSVARAAERLRLSQLTLSRHLRDLEDELGAEIFERRGDGVALSEAGQAVLADVAPLLRGFDLLRERSAERAGSLRGSVVGGVPPFVARLLGGELARRVASQEPGVTLRLAEDTHSALADQWVSRVESGRMDFCLGYWSQAPARLVLTPLGVEEFRVFGVPGRFDEGSVPLEALAEVPVWVPARHGHLRGTLRNAGRAAGVDLELRSEFDDWEDILARVARGDGVTVAPASLEAPGGQAGQVTAARLSHPPLGRMVSLLSRPPVHTTDAALFVAGVAHTLADRLVRDGVWSALPEQAASQAFAG